MSSPYAGTLGITILREGDGCPVCIMPPAERLVGRPTFLHGGAIAGLLEIAAYAALEQTLPKEERPEVKPIGVNVDFMRNGNMVETRAIGRVLRIGTRTASVIAEAWQGERDRPIAIARMMLSLQR